MPLKRYRISQADSAATRTDIIKRTAGWALVIAITAAMALTIAGEAYDINFAPLRLFQGWTRLGVFETRISDVESEFMRRSPELREAFDEFSACTRSEGSDPGSCDPKPILLKRDRAIRAAWPAMLDRLGRPGDWGEYAASRHSRNEYLAETEHYSAENLRDRCLPKITFMMSVRGESMKPYYRYDGLACIG